MPRNYGINFLLNLTILIKYITNDNFLQKRSVVNKENRRKLKELSYGGSQSIPALRYKKVS